MDLELAFKKCRARNHWWDDFVADRRKHPAIYQSPRQETLRCENCGTERYRGIGYTGDVESNYYDYADGYLYIDEDRPELAVIRLSLLTELAAIGNQRRRSTAHRSPAAKKRGKKATPKRSTPRHATARKKPVRRGHLQAV